MHLLLVQGRDQTQAHTFKFDNKADAEHQWEKVNEQAKDDDEDAEVWVAWITIEDDYGHRRRFDRYDVRSVALIDCEADIRGNVQLALLNQRGQVSAQRLSQADPSLTLATGAGANGLFRQ
jgi:signal transduction histidine kinase